MRTPTEYELQHLAVGYDPVKAHEYYLKTRDLKGRKSKRVPEKITEDDPRWNPKTMGNHRGSLDPRRGKNKEQIHKEAVARQKKEITEQIGRLQARLRKLEAKIREMEHKDASTDRKSEAKKERAAKERDKPKSAAEKRKAARDNEKYRDKHKQELKNKAKKASTKSGGGSDKKYKKKATIGDYKALVTKVKGQIAVAKQKLAAL